MKQISRLAHATLQQNYRCDILCTRETHMLKAERRPMTGNGRNGFDLEKFTS